ncbi:MAG: hypothetical protein UT69_C0029G0004 [Candidatus Yanofskybacteria bacterium GW2011_GWE1_40_10]|nr:MAG: hypothetical protein UT69_C0029G0004 [Candidatus Yanofskybacteria bacterium GW2011_GWE1_40_10]
MALQTKIKFTSLAYRLILAGIFVILSFEAGILFFSYQNVSISNNCQAKIFKPIIEQAILTGLKINVGDKVIKLKGEDIKDFSETYVRDCGKTEDIRLSDEKISEYLKTIAPNIHKEPVDARFQFKNGMAEILVPSLPGQRLNIDSSAEIIKKSILNGQAETVLIIDGIEPDITLEKISSLGIDTLIGRGESNFSGSSSARIQNIKVASARFNGLIIKPNEEISFNKILGEVDGKNGYAEEKVIKNHKMVYEFGGGVCQVSSTLFRAAIYAGLPIIERRPHAFAVQYYNPQGFDATIYPGVTDLKFLNNSGGHALVQFKIVGTKLSFEIYGASDGRKVEVIGPFQYDQQSDGSMKAYFERRITQVDGAIKSERFNSTYKSPALYPLEKNPLE